MQYPQDLLYTREHEWVRTENGIAVVGVTDYAQDQLGDVVYLDLPAVGARVAQFEKMGEIESVKTVSDLYSPITGEVVEVNEEAKEHPERVNEDPYGAGWLIRVRPRNPAEVDALLDAAAYEQLVSEA
ncbi:MAG: glycine cleavage system protein GcvH [Candidatus Rokubacteria bacterium]|nr:glycine cleavage system protein GcvH [Candidatus Rokubacteria bacterium]